MKYRYLYVFSVVMAVIIAAITIFFPPQSHGLTVGKYVSASGTIKKIETKSYGAYYIYISPLDSFYEYQNSNSTVKIPKGLVAITNDSTIVNKLKKGYEVTISGKFAFFDEATNQGQFDAKLYYETLGIDGKIENPKFNKASTGPKILAILYDFKVDVSKRIDTLYPETEAGIMSALLIGDRGSLPTEIKDLFKLAGVVHVLSISSLHVTLIGMSLFKFLVKANVPHKLSAMLSMPLMIGFCIAIDGSVSARRAVFMFVCRMVAVILGRTYDPRTAISTSALITLIGEPMLIHNSGFWLSYGCVYSIILMEKNDESLKQMKLGRKIQRAYITGLRIMIGTLPILLWFFNEVSYWGLLLNPLVMPLIGVTLGLGFISLLMKGLFLPIGILLSKIAVGILNGVIALCRLANLFGQGNLIPGKPTLIQVVVYYLILVVTFRILDKQEKKKVYVKPLTVMVSVLILILPHNISPRVTFLDVGQGDGIVVENGWNHTYLVDGGSSSKRSVGENIIIPYLKHQGISHIKGVFLSHPDADHVNGIVELIDEDGPIKIDSIIIAAVQVDKWKEKYPELFTKCKEKNIDVCLIKAGDEIYDRNLDFICLNPDYDSGVASDNSTSEVILLRGKTGNILLTGDLEGPAEMKVARNLEYLKENYGICVDVLKVAHHGSKNSTSDLFLSAASPSVALISVSKNNSYGHPHAETLERLAKQTSPVEIYRTDECGQITIGTRGRLFQYRKN